ncbi:MAG: tripartite tricarboxylate transporter substrate binding protein [Rubrivivax sp.]|nr:tripartite tricarboxylate transporter substrate binding protein [Rubrivivax sp.]
MQRRHLLTTLPALAAAPFARAQPAFPARPLRYVVPVAAGGGSDLVGRTVCERWARQLGQNIVVENIGGGGGAIACQAVAKAAPDGYTLLQGYVATHGTSPATRSKLPYDALRDFTPVGMIGGTPNVLVVNAALLGGVQTVAQFVAHLKANPGRVNYGSAGQGSLTHLTMELFKQASGTFALHIPYRGIAPAFTDLLGGQTQAMFPGLAAALPHIRSGRVRPLAVTGATRHPVLKDVPTLVEAGFPGFDALQWYGVVGPAGLPPAITRVLNDTLNAVLTGGDLRDKLAAEAVEPLPMAPEAFGSFIRADIERWTHLARERKIQLDD